MADIRDGDFDWIITVRNRSGGKPAQVVVEDKRGRVVGVAESATSTEAALIRAFNTARAGGIPGVAEFIEAHAISEDLNA